MAGTSERRAVVVLLSVATTLADDLRRLLDPASFEVRNLRSPAEASAWDDGAHVVVVDLGTLQEVGATAIALRAAPRLALVRRTSPDDVERARRMGALDVLAFPLDAAEVVIRIGAAVRLSRAEARMAVRDREMTTWADRAGHDLRSPLAVISGIAETLETASDRLPADDRDRLLAAIRNQAARATALVDEAIALARRGGPMPTGEPAPHP